MPKGQTSRPYNRSQKKSAARRKKVQRRVTSKTQMWTPTTPSYDSNYVSQGQSAQATRATANAVSKRTARKIAPKRGVKVTIRRK